MSLRRVLLLCPLLAAACETLPRRPDNAVDPRTYTACADPVALAAWQRAKAALATGDDGKALPDLRLAAERCPDLVRVHLAYQDCARRLGGEHEQAMVDAYMQAPVRPSPVPDYLRARLAETSYAQCNALEQILARDPSFAWAHLSRARVNRRQGRLLPALDMFAAAIVNDAKLHEARRERAQVLEELGRSEEAAVDYRRYLEAMPEDFDAMREFSALLVYRLSQIDEAIVWIEKLERQFPADITVRMDRAAALWLGGDTRGAVDAYLSVLADAPATARAALNIGLLYYDIAPATPADRQRYWPKARAAFSLFLARSSAAADGHEQFERTLAVPFRLARIQEELGAAAPAEVKIEDLRWPG